MGDNYIRISDVCKSFENVQVLRNVSLDVDKGSFVTLLGPSGCGKTTLLRLLAGLYEADSGEVWVDGRLMNGLPPQKRGMPLVFQDYALFPHMTIEENIGYGLRLRKAPRDEARAKVAEQMRLFGLDGLGKRHPRELSGGQQQRVAFARALICCNNILLLDEPLSNLDAKLRVEVRTELRRIQKQLGLTMIYVTHDQDEALSMSDVVAVMEKGIVRQIGSPREIYQYPENRFVADFVGAVNILPARVVTVDADGMTVALLGKRGRVSSQGGIEPGDMEAVVRPGTFAIAPPKEGEVIGEIVDFIFLGHMIRYRIEAGDATLLVDCHDPAYAPTSGKVSLTWDWSRVHVIRPEDNASAASSGTTRRVAISRRHHADGESAF